MGGSLKEDPSNWRSRIFPEHRETLPRLPGPGNLFASFTGAKNFFPSKFRKRRSAWRSREGDPLSPFGNVFSSVSNHRAGTDVSGGGSVL